MPDMLTQGKLFTVVVDGFGVMMALAPSGREIAQVRVYNETTAAHLEAARDLMQLVFEDLQAQGYPRAYDDLN